MFIVAENTAFTSKRGMLKSGDEVTEKDFATPEAFKKAISKGKVIEGKNKDALAAAAKKNNAEKVLQAAKDALAADEEALAKANTAIAEAEAKITPAREALTAKENENGDLAHAHKAITEISEALEKAKKPEDQTALNNRLTEARAAYLVKVDAVPEIKAVYDTFAAANREREEAVKVKANAEAKIAAAKEVVAAAENDLKAATAELAKVEGK